MNQKRFKYGRGERAPSREQAPLFFPSLMGYVSSMDLLNRVITVDSLLSSYRFNYRFKYIEFTKIFREDTINYTAISWLVSRKFEMCR
ncbi:hypothetical protein [Coxiella-like endosymbiont]|uniref:hypothetical protein n=1 Tax=Coxiella-like endosymbiont TaxID=1592897 RepID=UPI0028686A4A|nr:hypothetical protein [Coxiella-like endosymbiont]